MKKKSLILILSLLSSTSLFSQIPSYVPSNGLVGWWPFNGNANDESGNGNNGTVNGATLTADRNGNANEAYSFNNGFIETNYLGIGGAGSRTFSLWFYEMSNLTGGYELISYGANPDLPCPPYGDAFHLIKNGNLIELNLDCSTVYYSIPNYSINTWNHLVVLYPNAVTNLNDILMFCNNSQIFPTSQIQGNGNFNTVLENPLVIGKCHRTPPQGFTLNQMILDDIGIWNRALTQQEITALYQSNSCSVPAYVPTNGLVGYWPFCGNANDVSGNGNNGTVNGATLTTDRNGNANEAYSFDGVNDYIGIGGQNISSNGFALSGWIYTNSLQEQTIYYQGEQEFHWGIFNPINKMLAGAKCDPLTWYFTNNGVIPSLNHWNHVVINYSQNGKIYFYLNNSLVDSSNNVPCNSFYNPGLSSSIGAYNSSSRWFQGYLDDIGIWNRALTPVEIQQLYNSTPCTQPAPVTLGTSATTERCPNDQVTIKVVTPASDPSLTYQWTRNGTNLAGATGRTITVSDVAKYKVFVRSGPGVNCQRVSGLIETTTATPPSVTASAPNGTSYCPGDSVLMNATGATAGYSYQWKRYGVPVAGATSATFYAKQTGNYRCEITNAGGCISASNLISVTSGASCRMMQTEEGDVNVYPNPAKNSFTVSFNDIGNETPVSIELRNLQGQSIENRKLIGLADVQFNVGKLSPGMYMVRVMLESGDMVEKNVMVE